MKAADKTNQNLFFAESQVKLGMETANGDQAFAAIGASLLFMERALASWIEELVSILSIKATDPANSVWYWLKDEDWSGQSPETELLAETLARPGSWLFELHSNLKNLELTISPVNNETNQERAAAAATPDSNSINVINIDVVNVQSGASGSENKAKVVDKLLSDMKECINEARARQQEW